MSYTRPCTIDETVEHLAEGGWRILAGGTDVYPAAVERALPEKLLDLSQVKSLREIRVNDAEVSIGAGATWSDLINAPLPSAFDALKLAAREVGGVQIQNRGTLGGNLCNASPAADGVPPLLALDAHVELMSVRGVRRLTLDQFILGPRKTAIAADEFLHRIIVPQTNLAGESTASHFVKLGARRYLLISIAMAAVNLRAKAGRVTHAAVAIGACSPVAMRLPLVEAALIGASLNDALGERITHDALSVLHPIDDVRASADYRLDAAKTLLIRALDEAAYKLGGGR